MEPLSQLNPFIDYIADDKSDEKLKDLFDFYDVDGNGTIQRQELIDVLSLCAHEIGLEVDTYIEQLADAVFSTANLNQSGSITFDGLKEVLKQRPNLSSELSLTRQIGGAGNKRFRNARADGRWRRAGKQDLGSEPPLGETCGQRIRDRLFESWEGVIGLLAKRIPLFNKLRWEYISNNLVRFIFFVGICLVLLLLIVGRIVTYWNHCGYLMLARCAGQCLNFLCSIVVLLVCRRSISLLRAHGFSRYLPLDDHIYFHKIIGLLIVFYSLVHTFGHLLNFMVIVRDQKPDVPWTYVDYLFTTRPGIGWIGHSASITGWLLLIILAVMSLAQPFSRSLGKFELFYYTHLLYIPFWVLLFVHAPNFWIWFIGPLSVFIVEALIRLQHFLVHFSGEHTTIIKAVPLPSGVLHLVIKRPPNFEFHAGDWIYVLIPQIAKYEWHPFTISSAPEQEGVIWLHIRAVGEWTRSLRSYFDGLEHRNHLRRFIKSGQFSMSIDQYPSQPGVGGDLSPNDSTRYLGASRNVRDKLTHFKHKVTALAPIPESEASSYETVETASTNLSLRTTSSGPGPNQTPTTTTTTAMMTTTLINVDAPDLQQQSSTDSGVSSASSTSSTTSQRIGRLPNIKVIIDGPYGSPSSQIFRAEHAVLIATGIGVTPFASILQSIVNHYEKRRQKCPNCASEFVDTRPPVFCKLRKVDFVWINRDQKSFEWFIKLMAELELTQSHLPPTERFLDIHIHLTAMEPAKTNSIGLQLALYLVHEKNKKDLVTGLRTRTKAGRPNWDEFFHSIQDQKRGKVSVFFCGRPQLGRLLHRRCDSFGFKFRKEIF